METDLYNNVKLYVGSDSNPIDLTDPMDSLLVGLLSEGGLFR